MTPRAIFTAFGGLGLFLGSLAAVQFLFTTGGQILPSLLALAVGLAFGLAAGACRVIQLRYSETARVRLAAHVEGAPPTNWKRLWIGSLLIFLPMTITRALGAPVAVELTVVTLTLVVVLVQIRRRSRP